jgi:hydrogenase-4 membrane subunit HyfE
MAIRKLSVDFYSEESKRSRTRARLLRDARLSLISSGLFLLFAFVCAPPWENWEGVRIAFIVLCVADVFWGIACLRARNRLGQRTPADESSER